MKRRNLILGLGSISLAGASVFGSGAFSSVQADRDVTVNVAGDGAALLALEPAEGPNGDYASIEDGTLALNFDGSADGVDGQGFNAEATTRVDEVFTITNQGTQKVGVYIEEFETIDNVDIAFLAQNGAETSLVGADAAVGLPVGESIPVGLVADVGDVAPTEGDGVINGDAVTIVATVAEDEAPEIAETFQAFDPTDDELFEFAFEVDEEVSDVDQIDLSFGEDVGPTTSEDLTLRDGSDSIRRRNGRQYKGDPAEVVLRGTKTLGDEGKEEVVIDTVPADLGGGDEPEPEEAVLLDDDGEELATVYTFTDKAFVESQRLVVDKLDFSDLEDGDIDLDEIEITYPEGTDLDGADNGDFNVAQESNGSDDREPLRANNQSFDDNEAVLDISGTGFQNEFGGGTIEIVLNTAVVDSIESGEVSLTLKDREEGVVREFTGSFTN